MSLNEHIFTRLKYFKIQPDNLNQKQKKTAYILILICSIFLISVFWYAKKISDYESDLYNDINYEIIDCEIIDYNWRFESSAFKYFYKNQEFRFSQQYTSSILKIGEKYKGKVNINNPEIAILILDKPIIDTLEFTKFKAKIIDIKPSKNDLKTIIYKYTISDKKYRRTQYVTKKIDLNVNDKIDILYKNSNPKISYYSRKTGGNKM